MESGLIIFLILLSIAAIIYVFQNIFGIRIINKNTISILKIPFDKGILEKEKRGASQAPKKITKKGIFVEIDAGNFETTQKNIEKAALLEYRKNKTVLGIGGDHSISYGLIKAFDKTFENKALIYFDAHPDCQDYFFPPTYENVLRCCIEDTKILPKILLIGTREITSTEKKYLKEKNIKIFENIEDLVDVVYSSENIYVSIDIDVIDPKYAPGTGEPVKNGLSPEKLKEIIEILVRTKKIRGIDLVEVSPRLDENNKTVYLTTELLEKFLTL